MDTLNLNRVLDTETLAQFPQATPPNNNNNNDSANKIVSVKANSTVREVFDVLHSNHVFAVPVFGASPNEADANHKDVFVGSIDCAQITQFVVQEVQKKNNNGKNQQRGEQGMAQVLEGDIGNTPISKLLPPVTFGPFTPLTTAHTLTHACVVMGRLNVKRLPVVAQSPDQAPNSTTTPLHNFITQSSLALHILSFCEAKNSTCSCATATAAERGLLCVPLENVASALGVDDSGRWGGHVVVAVDEGEMLRSAFERMGENVIHGVGVRDSTKRVTGHVSASDTYFVMRNPALFTAMCEDRLTVAQFLEWRENESGEPVHPLVTCSTKATIHEILKTMCSKQISRVYVTNKTPATATTTTATANGESDQGDVVGVVSLTDVLSVLVEDSSVQWGVALM